MSEFILHVTSRTAWSDAQKSGEYAADSLAGQGFIHCSKVSQVLRVANFIYAGQHGLVLLVIDPARLELGTALGARRGPCHSAFPPYLRPNQFGCRCGCADV